MHGAPRANREFEYHDWSPEREQGYSGPFGLKGLGACAIFVHGLSRDRREPRTSGRSQFGFAPTSAVGPGRSSSSSKNLATGKPDKRPLWVAKRRRYSAISGHLTLGLESRAT